jgi:hypothetical protein
MWDIHRAFLLRKGEREMLSSHRKSAVTNESLEYVL